MLGLKLIQVGDSVGVVLPDELLARLKVEKGDVLYLTCAPEGLHLSPYDPSFEAQVATARKVMNDRRDALRKLGD